MNVKFERLAKIAEEEFGCKIKRSDKQKTFKDIFGIDINPNGECKYSIMLPTIGLCCNAYYKSERTDGREWMHFPLCDEKNCPLIHSELLEGAMLKNEGKNETVD